MGMPMVNREQLLSLATSGHLSGESKPAAFFLHFAETAHEGNAAIESHVRFFRETGNDIAKVQYEHSFPVREEIAEGGDWSALPAYGPDFFARPLEVVAGVVAELQSTAPVIVTLYSAYMFAQQTVGREALRRQLAEDPRRVVTGLRTIVESMTHFIEGCIRAGVDGFYVSTQGGEHGVLPPDTFEEYVMPWDRAVWEVIGDRCPLNVLHVCDYEGPYKSIDRYIDYPGHVVSAPTQLTDTILTGVEIAEAFGRPFMGGMERLGVLSNGPVDRIRAEAAAAIASGPPSMILGADCTLDSSTSWDNIAAAVDVAHRNGSTT